MIHNNPIIKDRLLSLSMPYKTAIMPIMHKRMIKVLFLRIYNVNFNVIKDLGDIM